MKFVVNNKTFTVEEIRNMTDEELKEFLSEIYNLGYNDGFMTGYVM